MSPQQVPTTEEGRTIGPHEIILIGVGNEFRTDDGLGVLVARMLGRRPHEGITVLENNGDGASMIDSWRGAEGVLLIDAVQSGDMPGTIHRIDVSTASVPKAFFHSSSTHLFGLAEAVEMARELRQLPRTTIIYGIEGQTFEYGPGLSDPVLRSVPSLLTMIEEDLHRLHPH